MTTQGKALTPAEKETIVVLKKYFDRTMDDVQEQASPSVQRVVIIMFCRHTQLQLPLAEKRRFDLGWHKTISLSAKIA